MKGFTPTAESRGFSPGLLWSGLRSGLPATCPPSASPSGEAGGSLSLRRGGRDVVPLSPAFAKRIGETKWCHRLARQRRINPRGSIGVTDNDWSRIGLWRRA